jgi:hypothetical protein
VAGWRRSRRSPGSARTARGDTRGRCATATRTGWNGAARSAPRPTPRRFASKIEVSVNEGTYIDPSLGRTLFKDWADEWLEGIAPALKPHTVAGYRTLLRKHVLPALGTMQLAKVRALDVRRVVAELSNSGLSPSRVRSTYFLVQAIFRAAVESGYIGRSPCVGVKLPRIVVREMHFLTVDEVRAISSGDSRPVRGPDRRPGVRNAPVGRGRRPPPEARKRPAATVGSSRVTG